MSTPTEMNSVSVSMDTHSTQESKLTEVNHTTTATLFLLKCQEFVRHPMMVQDLRSRHFPEVLLINQETTDTVAQITVTRKVDKVFNTFTKAISESYSTFIARIDGCMNKQNPDQASDNLKSSTDQERGLHIGQLFQIIADLYI
eukprot:403372179